MIATWVTDRNGSVYLNQAQRYVKGSIFVPQNEPIVTPAATLVAGTLNPGISPIQIIDSPQDALSELFSMIGEHAAADPADVQARLFVEITDAGWRRRLMNRAIPVNHVFGNRLTPFRVLESILLEAQQTLQFQFSNFSQVAPSNYRIAIEGRKFQASAMLNEKVTAHIKSSRHRKLFLQPYWLGPEFNIVIPAGGEFNAFFRNSRDLYNTLFKIMAYAIVAGGGTGDLQEIFSYQLFDAVTNRPMMNQPVTLNCGAGTAGFPYELPNPICMDPNTQLGVRFFNLITDRTVEVFFTFAGVASYAGPEQMMFRPPELAPPGALHIGAP